MRIIVIAFLMFGFLAVLSSCSGKQYQLLFEQRNKLDSTTTASEASLSNYRIKAQDILQIRNLQNINYIIDNAPITTTSPSGGGTNSAGQTYQVEEDGYVALPVIGRVQVAGLTRQEATKKIEELYRGSLLKDPIIEVKIVNLKVIILGEVKNPGNFPLVKDKTTLVEVIGEAGGLTNRADVRTIEIIRGSQTNPVITRVDLNNITTLTDPATILQNDDIIYVAENTRAARTDNLQNFTTVVQPVLLAISTLILIFTFSRR